MKGRTLNFTADAALTRVGFDDDGPVGVLTALVKISEVVNVGSEVSNAENDCVVF